MSKLFKLAVLGLALAFLDASFNVTALAQFMDEDSALAAEEILVEESLNGQTDLVVEVEDDIVLPETEAMEETGLEPLIEEDPTMESPASETSTALVESTSRDLGPETGIEAELEEELAFDEIELPADAVIEDASLPAEDLGSIEALSETPTEDLADDPGQSVMEPEPIVEEKGVHLPVEEEMEITGEMGAEESDFEEPAVAEADEDSMRDDIGVDSLPDETTDALVMEDDEADAVETEVVATPESEPGPTDPAVSELLDDAVRQVIEEEAAMAAEEPPPITEDDLEDLSREASGSTEPAVTRRNWDAVEQMAERERLRRQAIEAHGMDLLERGMRQVRERKFAAGIKTLEQSLENLGKRPQTADELKDAKDAIADAYYEWGRWLMRTREFNAAEEKARQAAQRGHSRGPALLESITRAKQKPEDVEKPDVPKRWNEQEYKEKRDDIAQRLTRGRERFLSGEYDQAQDLFESVLNKDPYNTEALRMMAKVTQKKYDLESIELETTRKHMMADLRETWNRRDYAVSEEGADDWKPLEPDTTTGEDSARVKILRKMEKIKIPEISFRQAYIHDVIDFLQEASVEFDEPTEDDSKLGVNIILNLGAKGEQTDAEPASPFGDLDSGESVPDDVPLITFSARYISLLEALKIVTRVANLKYTIQGSVVMVLPQDATIEDIIYRMYDVLPSFIQRVGEIGTELGGAGGRRGGGGGDFVELSGQSIGGERPIKEFFEEMGVKWPEGSSIKYISAIGKLVVANTADNLTVFEQILSVLNVVPNQIEIEARFVEVSQTDLDSLGFEWMLTDNWEIAHNKNSINAPLGARQRIEMKANAPGGFTKGNRFSPDISPSTGIQGIQDDLLTVAGVLTNPELTFVLHALQQKGNTDLLSAPKVTTQSGQEATIKVVTEYIYPTDFTVTPVTATAAGGSGTAQIVGGIVEPSSFETREVGVILTVLPEVSTEGQMITLTMTPEVVEEPEWRNFGTTFTDPQGVTQQLNMEQPFFHTRSVSTSISIYNGATVVMGGMITENRVGVDDKVPLLGDIPLIGRIFRSRYDRSEKRNLLIFVTARLVDPAGRPVERATEALGSTLVRDSSQIQ